jgi:hypothetical protein
MFSLLDLVQIEASRVLIWLIGIDVQESMGCQIEPAIVKVDGLLLPNDAMRVQ